MFVAFINHNIFVYSSTFLIWMMAGEDQMSVAILEDVTPFEVEINGQTDLYDTRCGEDDTFYCGRDCRSGH